MPRYFFDVHDGTDYPDTDGVELSDIFAARREAVVSAGQWIQELGGKFWEGESWSMNVKDEQDFILFVLHFSGFDSAAASGSRNAEMEAASHRFLVGHHNANSR